MKIILAAHHFPPRYTGGAELRTYRTAKWFQDRGHEVHVIAVEAIDRGGDDGLSFEDTVYDGLPVRRLSFNLAAAPDPFRWTYDNPWIGRHLRQYLAQIQPDVFHLISGYLMSGSALRAAGTLRIPTVLTLTDFWFLCPRITLLRSNGQLSTPPFEAATCAQCLGEEKRRYRYLGRIAPRLMRAYWQRQMGRIAQVQRRMDFLQETLNLVDAIISPSQFLRDLFIEAGVSPERIVFSRQGRDFPHLTPEELVKSPSEHLRIGYMGQIAPHKGVHTLFQAVQRLPGANLKVTAYGDVTPFPDYTRRLRQMARQDARLELAGVFERTQVSRVLQDLDVIVVPSINYENSPNTILEAFAHRTPVVVSDLGGMAELVENGVNGLTFAAGDAASLAAQLRRLLEEPGLLARLRQGIQPVKTRAQEMAELLQIYAAVSGEGIAQGQGVQSL